MAVLGRTIATGSRHRDADLQHVGEKGHAILEKVVGDLHDARDMLAICQRVALLMPRRWQHSHDGDLGRLRHLEGSVKEAVLGHAGVRVDDENDLSTARELLLSLAWCTVSDLTHILMLPSAQVLPSSSSTAFTRAK